MLPAARHASTSLAAAVVVALTLPARAQAPAPQAGAAAAELLDSEATALMQEHRYAEACPKLAESDRIKPGTGVLLRLALCYQLLGRAASAWSAFREAAGRARRAGDAQVAEIATRRAQELEPRLPRLVVRLAPGDDPASVDVRLDGVRVVASALGIEVPVDAGAHTVRATAAGRRAYASTFTIADRGATTTVSVDLGPASPPAADPGALQRTLAFVAGGVGVAGVAAGSILGVAAMANWNKARSECKYGTSGCSGDALALQPVVNGEALGSTVAFTVGAVGLAGAALLWWTAPSRDAGRRAAYVVAPSTDGRGLALSLGGSF